MVKRGSEVNRQRYEEARKPVQVLNEQYENISSDEEENMFEETVQETYQRQGQPEEPQENEGDF